MPRLLLISAQRIFAQPMTWQTLVYFAGFALICIASFRVATLFQIIKLPFISGLLIVGLISGSSVLNLLPHGVHVHLNFINEISLAFIALAAGSELYIKDLRSRVKSIVWNTAGQLFFIFLLSSFFIYQLSPYIPEINHLDNNVHWAIAILMASIFIASSPSSAIAVINELRAKGPFTQTAIGVTVIKDVLVIILFTINLAIALALVNNEHINLFFIMILLAELGISFLFGYLLGKLLAFILTSNIEHLYKTILILISAYLVYIISHLLRLWSSQVFNTEILLEPLLICIIGSYIVSNYSSSRFEFSSILKETGPWVYTAFFTLTGLSLSLDILLEVWKIALILFGLRLVTMIIGSFSGASLAGDDRKFRLMGWMPYVTQAGVGLGLATVVAAEIPEWGEAFMTLVIAVIVINQFVGPPIFKWSLIKTREGHQKAINNDKTTKRNAIIFGLDNQSIALAKQLINHGWTVLIVTLNKDYANPDKINVIAINEISRKAFVPLKAENAGSIITLLSDDDNFKICEIAYEYYGTKNLVVRLNNRENFDKFHRLDAKIIDPATSMVSLLDHFVRSPNATSLLMGMDPTQDTVDIELRNKSMHGMALRNIRFPSDILVLSVKRKGSTLISHGFTRLRKGDIVTVVGSPKSVESVMLRLDKQD